LFNRWFGDNSVNSTYIIITIVVALAIILISLIILSQRKRGLYYKINHKERTSLKIKEKIIVVMGSLIGLAVLLWLGKYLIYGLSKLWVFFATSNLIEDALFRNILLVTFIAVITIVTFKALKIKIDISMGGESPIQSYWNKLHKESKKGKSNT
jgi:hypothetical protein